jgi:hypothetical protein
VPYFKIGQHTRSLMVLNAITAFLQSLPKGFTFSLNSLPPVVSNSLNKTTAVSVITINSIDALHDYLMFFLLRFYGYKIMAPLKEIVIQVFYI